MTGVAHVICCNDSVEHVFLGNKEGAQELLEELASAHYFKYQAHWDEVAKRFGPRPQMTGWAYYRHHIRWHIRTVPLS